MISFWTLQLQVAPDVMNQIRNGYSVYSDSVTGSSRPLLLRTVTASSSNTRPPPPPSSLTVTPTVRSPLWEGEVDNGGLLALAGAFLAADRANALWAAYQGAQAAVVAGLCLTLLAQFAFQPKLGQLVRPFAHHFQ